MAVFTLTAGTDNFTGNADEYNVFNFTPTTLSASDTITGGATGGFADVLVLTAGGAVTAGQFALTTNIEQLILAAAGNTVALSNGLVAGTSFPGGVFAVIAGAGIDNVDASGVNNGIRIAFRGNGGNDTFIGGTSDDLFLFAPGDLTAGNTLAGAAGIDTVQLLGGGVVAADAFTNVSGIDVLGLSHAGNTVTLTNALAAGDGTLQVFDGAGNDTVIGSGVNNNRSIHFRSQGGNDTLTGGNWHDTFFFNPTDLNGSDVLVGGAGFDAIQLTAGGAIAAAAFAQVTGVDALVLNDAGNNVTLSNSLLANNDQGGFAVVDGTGNDVVDGSGITNGLLLAVYSKGGTDSFIGGNGNDFFSFNAGDLTGADSVVGGGGYDAVFISSTGAVNAADFAGVSGIEALVLGAGNHSVTLSNALITGSSSGNFAVVDGASGTDTVDASAAGAGTTVAFYGGAGADTYVGGAGSDYFVMPDAGFSQLTGNGGLDRLLFSSAFNNQTFDLTANASKISNVEIVSLANATNASLTLVGADIPQVNATGNLLYVVGGADDQVDAGAGWVLISSSHTNAAVAPGVTFVQYHHTVSNAELYVADQIALTIDANDAPVVATSAFAPSYTEDGAPTAVDTGFTVSDVDDTNLESALVSITGGLQAGDVLGFTPQFGITDTNAAPEILALSGTATLAEWQTVLQSITFSTTSQAPGTSRTVSITVNDGDNNSAAVIKDVTVTSVNDAPAGTDNTVTTTEGTPYVFTVADFGFTDTDANALFAVQITTLPAAGTLTLNSTPVNAGDFIQAADITAGFLVYTPPAGAGSSFTFQVQDNGGVANGGVDLDQTANTLTIAINTPPVANDDTASATEAGGTSNDVPGLDPLGNLVTGVGTGSVADTDAEDPATALTVVAVGTGAEGSPDNGTVGVFLSGTYGQLRLMADGSYTYEVDQNNAAVQALLPASTPLTDIFHYTIEDTAGAPDSATLTISVGGANDLPQANDDPGGMTEESAPALFPVGANDVPDPDAGAANTIAITGTVIASGPGGAGINDGDATAVVVGNQIEVTLNGDFQALTASESATVQVPYTLTGNVGETDTATLTVTVTGVNDGVAANDDTGAMSENDGATLFDVRSNDTLDVDHTALNTVSIGTVTASGPAGDGITGADVTTAVVGNQVQITLGADFQNLGDGETATIDVQYTLTGDQPGDTDTATLQVTVTGANDAPVAGDFTFNSANAALGNTALVVNDATDGAPDPTGPQKTISGDLLAGATDVDTALSSLSITAETVSNASGSITFEADGDFIYHPAAGFSGNAVFNYTVNDNDPSGNLTDTGQINIEVAAPKVWYVDDSAAPGGDGTSDNPFNSLAALSTGGSADALDGANDIIFVYGGTYASGIVLEDGQQLIGQSQGLTVNGTALEAVSGGNPLINGAVVLASGNTIDGIDIGNTGSSSVFALSGANVGNAVFTDGSINNTSGGAININGSGIGMNLQFTSVSSTNSSTNAISFNEARGTFNAGSGTLSNAGGNTVTITGNGANDDLGFTYGGAINDDGNLLVAITGQTGGTKDFNGTLTDGAGAGGGISLLNNNGATIRFDGGMSLNTTASGAFAATGGGTVVVTDTISTSNILSTTTGTALNVANTTIGAEDLTFQSISSNGGSATGIILDNTGALGGLHVTGTGAAGSGGTIANKTGADGSTTTGIGIYLNNTADAQLDRMQLNGFENFAIQASDVNGFSLQNSVINGNNGNSAGADEGAILFLNSSGTINIANSQISGGFEDNLRVLYDSATADAAVYNITNNDFTDLQSGNNALVNLRSTTTASASSNVTFNFGSPSDPTQGNTFDNSANQNPLPPPNTQWFGDGILVTFEGPFQHTINIDNNTFFELFQAIDFAAGFSADVNARIYNNNITYTEGVGAIAFGTASTSTASMLFQMLIEDNDIGGLGNDSGSRLGSGIVGDFRGAETARVTIHQNVVQDAEVNPIRIISQMTTLGDGDTHLRITNNTVASIDDDAGAGAGVIPGIEVTTNAATNGDIFLTISGNISTGINEDGILVRQATGDNTFSLEDFAGNGTIAADVDAYLEAQNPGTTARVRTGGSVVQYTSQNLNNTDTPAPLTPLLAADGGVEAAGGSTVGGVLTTTVLATLADAAVARWTATGLSVDQLATLNGITITVADLRGDNLGHFDNGQIVIDDDAAGRGWFIDDTPLDDVEFANMMSGTWLRTDPTGAPAGHFDLLTLIMHEMGHGLGLDDTYAAADHDELMYGELAVGERRLPDIDDAFDTSHDTEPGAAVFADHAHLADEQGLPVKGAAAYYPWLLHG